MKKTLLLLFISLFGFQGIIYADYQIDDFENGNLGWNVVSCYFDIRTNAYKGGLNSSNNVLFTNRGTANDNWSGATLSPAGAPITGYNYLHVKMYRNNTNPPNVKVSESPAADLAPMGAVVANQWQDVVFDVSTYNESGIQFVFLMVDRSMPLDAEAWMLVDDIMLSNDPTPRGFVYEDFPEDGSGTNGYYILWEDLFNDASLNTSNWNAESDCSGGGNFELQCYRPENVTVGKEPATGKNCLILTAKKENFGGKYATSGRVNSLNKQSFTHGKIEASIKTPYTANGLWPAFWMLGSDIETNPWPACGEIDILEMGHKDGIIAGTQNRFFNGACHWGHYDNGNYPNYGYATTNSYNMQGDFHLYTLIWDESSVKMYLDLDKYPAASPYYQMDISNYANGESPGHYFHKPFHLIFNLAVGGSFPNMYDINQITALNGGNAAMYVDYVKVYKPRGVKNIETLETKSALYIYPNPTTDYIQANEILASIMIYDLLGELVLNAENTDKVNVSDLNKGIYIINLITENGVVKSQRIIKE